MTLLYVSVSRARANIVIIIFQNLLFLPHYFIGQSDLKREAVIGPIFCLHLYVPADMPVESLSFVEPTTLPVYFKIIRSTSSIKSSSEKLGAFKATSAVPSESSCFYYEISIEVRLLGSNLLTNASLPFFFDLLSISNTQDPGTSESRYICIGGASSKFGNSFYPGSKSNSFGYSSVFIDRSASIVPRLSVSLL